MKRYLIPAGIVVLIIAIGLTALLLHPARGTTVTTATPVHSSVAVTPQTQPQTTPSPDPSAPPAFNKSQYSTADPTSIWAIVNKSHPVTPSSYVPADLTTQYGKQLRSVLAPDLTNLMNDATSAGEHITLLSGYRSFASQTSVYNGYVRSDGQANADTYSARPGFSEHQLGLAMDFGNASNQCAVEQCYGNTSEAKWLAANAYRYGFLLRYTVDDQSVTGYEAEPWHYRYIGKDLARYMHDNNISTLEAMFGVSGGQTYN